MSTRLSWNTPGAATDAQGPCRSSIRFITLQPDLAWFRTRRPIAHTRWKRDNSRGFRDYHATLLRPAALSGLFPYLLWGLSIERANQVWTMDSTYIPMARGFVHLTAVLDWHSRRVLAHRVAITMETPRAGSRATSTSTTPGDNIAPTAAKLPLGSTSRRRRNRVQPREVEHRSPTAAVVRFVPSDPRRPPWKALRCRTSTRSRSTYLTPESCSIEPHPPLISARKRLLLSTEKATHE
jgi:hypothetical protein